MVPRVALVSCELRAALVRSGWAGAPQRGQGDGRKVVRTRGRVRPPQPGETTIAEGTQHHGRELPGVHPKRSPVSETVVFLLSHVHWGGHVLVAVLLPCPGGGAF